VDTEETNVNHQPMSFTITESLERLPTFVEIKTLAEQHDIRISGNEQAGDFCHPGSGQSKITGRYAVEPGGGIRGDFSAQVMGKLAGTFAFTAGKAVVTITEKPFLLPEAILRSQLSTSLKDLCARFSG
jgi:hypothetical protein